MWRSILDQGLLFHPLGRGIDAPHEGAVAAFAADRLCHMVHLTVRRLLCV